MYDEIIFPVNILDIQTFITAVILLTGLHIFLVKALPNFLS